MWDLRIHLPLFQRQFPWWRFSRVFDRFLNDFHIFFFILWLFSFSDVVILSRLFYSFVYFSISMSESITSFSPFINFWVLLLFVIVSVRWANFVHQLYPQKWWNKLCECFAHGQWKANDSQSQVNCGWKKCHSKWMKNNKKQPQHTQIGKCDC